MLLAEDDVLDDAPYAVTAVEPRTPTIVEIWLSPVAEPIEYAPGQYVLLEEVAGDVPPRSYSIANAPRLDGAISLFVTRVPDGSTSGWIHDHLTVGDGVSLSGPYGTFVAA